MLIRIEPRRAGFVGLLALLVMLLAPTNFAGEITRGDVTDDLGPDFLVDNASPGGQDAQAHQPQAVLSRNDVGPLNVGEGGSRITITGVGFACPNNQANNDATSVEVRVIYLGRDGVGGGRDDVVIANVTGAFNYNGAGEYVFEFDEPVSAVIDGRNSFFRVDLRPTNDAGNGSIRIKSANNLVKVSIAGTSAAVD